MPSHNYDSGDPPSSAFDVLDSRLRFLRAEIDALDEIIGGAQTLLELNEQGRLTFCTQMARLALDELAQRALGDAR